MRIRRAEVEWSTGKASLDCRNEGNVPLSVVGITGPNGSGKSLLQLLALRCYANSQRSDFTYLDWDDVSGYVEFEFGGTISTAVVKNGKVVQNIANPNMRVESYKMDGGMLGYNRDRLTFRDMNRAGIGETNISIILHDLYKYEVRNSVIWVDDFDLGLDSANVNRFLQVLTKKALERDNQLIVSTAWGDMLDGLGWDNTRILTGAGIDLVDRALKGLSTAQV